MTTPTQTLPALPDPRTYGMTYAIQDGMKPWPDVLAAHPDRACMEREAAGGHGHVVPLFDADQMRAYARAALAAQPAPAPDAVPCPTWQDAERISNLHGVDAAIRTLLDDQTADNATGAVLAVLAADRAGAATVAKVAEPQPLDWLQAGFNNAELLAHWRKKLPGVEPTDRELSAFAVGTEVGFARARDLEKQDWSRAWHALKDAGVHPGRTDDRIETIIARLAAERDAALAAAHPQHPAPQPLTTALCPHQHAVDDWRLHNSAAQVAPAADTREG